MRDDARRTETACYTHTNEEEGEEERTSIFLVLVVVVVKGGDDDEDEKGRETARIVSSFSLLF